MIPAFWGGFISGIGVSLIIVALILWRIYKSSIKKEE